MNNKCLNIIFKIVDSNWFLYFITFSIIANTIVLAFDKYPIEQD
jgi:hypothetical protein